MKVQRRISHHNKSLRMQHIFRKLNLQSLNNDRLIKCLQKFFDDSLMHKQYWWYQQSIGGLNEHHRRKRFTSKMKDMDITTWCSSASGLYFYTTYHWHPLNQWNNRSVDTKADGSRFQEASATLVNKTGENYRWRQSSRNSRLTRLSRVSDYA